MVFQAEASQLEILKNSGRQFERSADTPIIPAPTATRRYTRKFPEKVPKGLGRNPVLEVLVRTY